MSTNALKEIKIAQVLISFVPETGEDLAELHYFDADMIDISFEDEPITGERIYTFWIKHRDYDEVSEPGPIFCFRSTPEKGIPWHCHGLMEQRNE